MRLEEIIAGFDPRTAGAEMHALVRELFPICRSITGDGVRRTLEILSRRQPIEIREIASGTPVLDWTVPPEWNVREAWVRDPNGDLVIDFRSSNLHLVGYSVPVRRRMPLAELRRHLYTLPDRPDWIPYRTSYYKETWGFCLSHRRLESLREGEYEVVIDTTLAPGKLTWGELVLPGELEDEVLISAHVCHPSLANDNLSGVAVALFLAGLLAGAERRHTFRFLFIPGTIGSIVWLATNPEAAGRVRAGLVAANLGDPGAFTYKRSRRGEATVDRAAARALADAGAEHALEDFVPFGYDERQYCSPGFNLPVGSLTRTPWGRYPQYHTSADDPDFVRPEALGGSLGLYLEVARILERNRRFLNLEPRGEPQLGRRGLYGSLGGREEGRERELALLWVLNLSDGEHDLLAIAERSGLSFAQVSAAADRLLEAGLLR